MRRTGWPLYCFGSLCICRNWRVWPARRRRHGRWLERWCGWWSIRRLNRRHGRFFNAPALNVLVNDFTAAARAFALAIQVNFIMTILAIALYNDFEFRAAVFTGCRLERDLLGAHRAFLLFGHVFTCQGMRSSKLSNSNTPWSPLFASHAYTPTRPCFILSS